MNEPMKKVMHIGHRSARVLSLEFKKEVEFMHIMYNEDYHSVDLPFDYRKGKTV